MGDWVSLSVSKTNTVQVRTKKPLLPLVRRDSLRCAVEDKLINASVRHQRQKETTVLQCVGAEKFPILDDAIVERARRTLCASERERVTSRVPGTLRAATGCSGKKFPLVFGLAVYRGPLGLGGELDAFRPRDSDIVVIRGRAELAEGELLAVGSAGVNAVLRHVDDVVSDVKSDDRVIHAIVRADAGDDDMVAAGTEIVFVELLFHGGPVETVVGIFFYNRLAGSGFKLLDELYCRSVVDERVRFPKEGEFGMVFGPD